MGATVRNPVLAWATWPGVVLVVVGAAAFLYGFVAVVTAVPYPPGIAAPQSQWTALPGVLAPIGAFILAWGIVAILIGRRAGAVARRHDREIVPYSR